MAREQYVATDKATGVEVAVTGEFPPHPEDRMRIARTTTLFTRLMSTLLSKDESDRRTGFRAVETQLELADAMIRQDMAEVRRLVRETMENMGVSREQLADLARHLREVGGLDDATAQQLSQAFGLEDDDAADAPLDDTPPPAEATDAPERPDVIDLGPAAPPDAPPDDGQPPDDEPGGDEPAPA